MSNNSMVTADGAEIGRAQWVQAVAARAEPEAAMNPVLLKPGSDRRSHVVVMGRPAGHLEAERVRRRAYGARRARRSRRTTTCARGTTSWSARAPAAPRRSTCGPTTTSTWGSRSTAAIPTVLVGDIDRGGVFAAMHGTLALLDAADQALLAGFVVNKFRGELSLLRPGLDTLERLTGRPVLGVLPWMRDLLLDSEDSLALHRSQRPSSAVTDRLRVAVVVLPRISNFTDVDALCLEPGLDVAMVDSPRGLAGADVVVLPGTRATIEDLAWLRARGLADAVVSHAEKGGAVLGICGGFQMLGRSVARPARRRGGARRVTSTGSACSTCAPSSPPTRCCGCRPGRALGVPASGYEIHHGRVTVGDAEPFLGGARSGSVFGTMWHGSLEGDELRRAWLAEVAAGAGVTSFDAGTVSFAAQREAQIDALADAVEEHLDLDRGPRPGRRRRARPARRDAADWREGAAARRHGRGPRPGRRARRGRRRRGVVAGRPGAAAAAAGGGDPARRLRRGGRAAGRRWTGTTSWSTRRTPSPPRSRARPPRPAQARGVPLLRLARPSWSALPTPSRWRWVDSTEEAAAAAAEVGGPVFLTTGRQSLQRFLPLLGRRARCWRASWTRSTGSRPRRGRCCWPGGPTRSTASCP